MSKVVLVTGASSGIGEKIAEYLSEKGFIVYGTSRNPNLSLERTFELIPLDVTNHKLIEKAINYVIEMEGRIDILINNAGKGITGPIEETPLEEIKANFDTNFYGLIEISKAVLPQMRQQKSGLIINISSIAGFMGLPYRGIYSASKSAVSMISEALSAEVKQFGIKIVDVAPGDFITNIAAGRFHAPVLETSAYQSSYQKVLNQINEEVNFGLDTLVMAKAIHHIILQKNPKLHYKIGKPMQRFSIVLKRILPDRWYEKLIMNHYKL
ncbi:MAG: SDR family oxidoreductase [Flavobacteriaceae bacterium]|jgi:short-subunit dehydrogenase|nr:SDR family oxidoreductase [Flavobacteriaceae bacterium]